MSEHPLYIVYEGIDATGKSTQVPLTRTWIAEEFEADSVEFHEPGGLPVTDAIRETIKNGNLERLPETDLLLFTAARHELWNGKGEPALRLGQWAVAARNWYSSLVYQGHADGLGFEKVEQTTKMHLPSRYIKPDLTIMLTIMDEEVRKKRIEERGILLNPDTFESRDADFQQRLHRGYEIVSQIYPVRIIDASGSVEDVQSLAQATIKSLLAERSKRLK